MTATTTTAASAARLFRNLHAAETTAAGYNELAALLERSARIQTGGTSTVSDIFRAELDRLRSIAEEMENDADDRRDAILDAGYTPAQYDTWLAAKVSL